MVAKASGKSEAATRRDEIDPRLRAQGWVIVDNPPAIPPDPYKNHAVREYPTVSGPADYVLFVRGRLVGVIEAKKRAVDSQTVLTQAERYARGLPETGFNEREAAGPTAARGRKKAAPEKAPAKTKRAAAR